MKQKTERGKRQTGLLKYTGSTVLVSLKVLKSLETGLGQVLKILQNW
jgi:hypothetical protein